MSNPQEPGKRIVSKGKYAVLMGKKAAKGLFGAFLAVVTAVCILCVFGFLFWATFDSDAHGMRWLRLVLAVLFALLAYCSKRLAEEGMLEATQKEDVLPFTRTNVAQIPAQESLVRASEEPLEEQQGVLLRATTGSQETAPEQLVRPAERQE